MCCVTGTITGKLYLGMLEQYVFPKLEQIDNMKIAYV